jgi:hypothetical protein
MPDWVRDSFTIGAPFVSALMIYVLTRFHDRNKRVLAKQDKVLADIDANVKHIDDCLDRLRERVANLEGWRLWGRPASVEDRK